MEKDEKVFKAECIKYINKLHLNDWDIGYLIDNGINDFNRANGYVMLNPEGRKATICLCENREKNASIEKIAKHECLEILLADIGFLLKRYYSEEVIENETHKVINKLMVAL
jgi:hypothetical protein